MIFTRNGVKLLKQTRCGVKIKWKTRHQNHWKYVRTSGVAKARRAVRELAACKTLASIDRALISGIWLPLRNNDEASSVSVRGELIRSRG